MIPAPKPLAKSFLRGLKNLQKEAEFSPRELAAAIGVGESTLRGWYDGSRSPQVETIEQVETRLTAKRRELDRLSAAIENALPYMQSLPF